MADRPSNVDDAKGRVKEGVGVVTGNERLRREGRTEQAAGKVKKAVDKVADKVKGRSRREN